MCKETEKFIVNDIQQTAKILYLKIKNYEEEYLPRISDGKIQTDLRRFLCEFREYLKDAQENFRANFLVHK